MDGMCAYLTDSLDLAALPHGRLMDLVQAGRDFLRAQAELEKVGRTILDELTSGRTGRVVPYTHYPPGDVYDYASHSQYYFHSHRSGEIGHIHTFLRPRGMPLGVHPADPSDWRGPDDNDALSHLVAIGLGQDGWPTQLFTTNRWVTAEVWYRADAVKQMLPCFSIAHDRPSHWANLWVSSLVGLFAPQIEWLLDARDAVIENNRHRLPGIPVLEDRDLEMTSAIDISVHNNIEKIISAVG